MSSNSQTAAALAYARSGGEASSVRIDTVLISTQHGPGIDLTEQLLPDLTEHVIKPLLPADLDCEGVRILANPTGIFELGGPHAETEHAFPRMQ